MLFQRLRVVLHSELGFPCLKSTTVATTCLESTVNKLPLPSRIFNLVFVGVDFLRPPPMPSHRSHSADETRITLLSERQAVRRRSRMLIRPRC